MGTMAGETLSDTMAVLQGLRVEIDARIAMLGKMRSTEALMERARAESGGLPETAAIAAHQAGADMVEVEGSPGQIALKAGQESEAASRDEAEAGPVEDA